MEFGILISGILLPEKSQKKCGLTSISRSGMLPKNWIIGEFATPKQKLCPVKSNFGQFYSNFSLSVVKPHESIHELKEI